MSNEVGNVLKVNFVQGEDYLQDILIYKAEAANSAAVASLKANEAASSANQANAYKNQAANSATASANSAAQAQAQAVNAANSATASANSATASANSAIASANSAGEAKDYRDEAKAYDDDTKAHYNQFYIDLNDIRNIENLHYETTNEWINLHDGAFSLVNLGLCDNDGVPLDDNDGVVFGGMVYMPITDYTLTQYGVPADAGTVGNILFKVDKLVESWQDNFTQREVYMADNDGEPILDEDGEPILVSVQKIVTDSSLTLEGVPADAYAVGQALQAIRDLIATYHP